MKTLEVEEVVAREREGVEQKTRLLNKLLVGIQSEHRPLSQNMQLNSTLLPLASGLI